MASNTAITITCLQVLLQKLPRLDVNLKPTVQEEGKFTVFIKLPNELKDRIWHYVAQEERLIKLEQYGRFVPKLQQGQLFDHQPAVPPILHVCRDSRVQGMKYYTKCEEKEVIDLTSRFQPPRAINRIVWVNFQRDLFVSNGEFSYQFDEDWFNFPSSTIRKIQRMAVIQYGEHNPSLFKLAFPTALHVFFKQIQIEDISLVRTGWMGKCQAESVDGDLVRREELRRLHLEILEETGKVLRMTRSSSGDVAPVNVVFERISDVDLAPMAAT